MILSVIISTLIISSSIILLLPNSKLLIIKSIALGTAGLVFVLSSYLISIFDFNNPAYQFVEIIPIGLNIINVELYLALDGLSIFFFYLTSILIFLCILFCWENDRIKENMSVLLVLELLLLLVFSVLDLLLFYIFFEAILIPMFFLIGFLGSRSRKIRAAYLLFFYTLFGSLLMLIGIVYIYSKTGSLNIEYISSFRFTDIEQKYLWLAFFLSFASKIPMFPFHIWLPEAHVEAPTIGSVLLAGILLKLGVYGFLRYSLNLFPDASLYFSPLVYLLSIIGIIYASFTAIRQTDIKRIIAYSSIAHMNLVTIGIFSFNILGIEGSLIQSISHGFVSGGMFLMIGILYERYHSRLLFYYGGLVHVMPIYSTYLLVFTLANIALPGTSSFVGEFLLFCGIFKTSSFICVICAFSVILCGAYSLWLYNRLIFGNLKIAYTKNFKDLTFREFILLTILVIPVIFVGINPSLFSKGIKTISSSLILFIS